MSDLLEALLTAHHGVLSTAELNRVGISARQTQQWVKTGKLVRIHRGKYLAPKPINDYSVARALSGELTCLSALHHMRLWVPKTPEIPHVQISRGVRQSIKKHPTLTEIAKQARLHVSNDDRKPESDAVSRMPNVAPLAEVLLAAQYCCTRNELVAIGDSLLRRGVTSPELARIARYGTNKLRDAFGLLDEKADSGIESIMRMHLHPLRVRVRSQVKILGWRVDLLVGDWLIIELDGYEFHSTPKDARRDKRKDRELNAAGFTMLRYSHNCVMYDWAEYEPQLLQFIHEGRHLRPSIPGKELPTFE